MTTPWTHISEAPAVGPHFTAIHCDTRDFVVMYSCTTCSQHDQKEVYRLLHGKINERFLIPQGEIIPWLKHIEAISGGRCEWRCLNFTHIKTALGWLKYIRFYRYTTHLFVVCDDGNAPIDWQRCSEQTIEKEYLNAIKEELI